MHGVNIASHAADQVAGLLVIVISERQPLDLRVEGTPQVVHYPLAGAGGEVLLRVAASRSGDGDDQRGGCREAQNSQPVFTNR